MKIINFKKFKKFYPNDKTIWHVYFLMNKKEIVYIGCTNDYYSRINRHYHLYDPFDSVQNNFYYAKKIFTHYRIIKVGERRKAFNLEYKMIKKFNPKYNDYRNYYWHPTNKTVQGRKNITRNICIWKKRSKQMLKRNEYY